MKERSEKILNQLYINRPDLKELDVAIRNACNVLYETIQNGNKILICGNGGSSADSDHIVGELMKGFVLKRPLDDEVKSKLSKQGEDGVRLANMLQQGIPAISLNVHQAVMSATANDIDPEYMFAQQMMGYGNTGDILIGISTSGNANNVVQAMKVAKALDVKTLALVGKDGGLMEEIADYAIRSNKKETYLVQEDHLSIYHALCAVLESELFEC